MAAKGAGQAQIVYHADGRPVGGCAQPAGYAVEQLALVGDVQMVSRLVQQQQVGVLGHDLGQEGPLQLPAGKGQNGPIRQRLHAGEAKGLLDPLAGLGVLGEQPALAVGIAAHGGHLGHGKGGVSAGMLGQDPHMPGPVPGGHGFHLPAQEPDPARMGDGLGNGPQQGGFSRPVGAYDHQPIPRG